MRDDRVYLLHIRDAVQDIREFTREEKSSFLSDRKSQAAVVRSFEIIGEAVKRLSDDLKRQYPEGPVAEGCGDAR